MHKLHLISKKYAHVLILACLIAITAFGAVVVFARSGGNAVINEVCSSNVACCEDENGDYPDWIEI